jgi:hypothetical protein
MAPRYSPLGSISISLGEQEHLRVGRCRLLLSEELSDGRISRPRNTAKVPRASGLPEPLAALRRFLAPFLETRAPLKRKPRSSILTPV